MCNLNTVHIMDISTAGQHLGSLLLYLLYNGLPQPDPNLSDFDLNFAMSYTKRIYPGLQNAFKIKMLAFNQKGKKGIPNKILQTHIQCRHVSKLFTNRIIRCTLFRLFTYSQYDQQIIVMMLIDANVVVHYVEINSQTFYPIDIQIL